MGSNIKGGGRATWSAALEDKLIDVLMARCDDDSVKFESKHKQAHQRKRFVKRLVKQYKYEELAKRYEELAKRFNQSQSSAQQSIKNDSTSSQKTTVKTADACNDEGKVRIELIEAIWKDDKKNKNKESGWKEGAKKVMVLAKSTSVAELLKQAKTKLRMKKVVRAFVAHQKLEMDLAGDLRGLKDGDTVYVTAQELQTKTPKEDKGSDKEDEEKDNGEDIEFVDPLVVVKEAYAKRNQNQRLPQAQTVYQYTDLSPYLEKLSPLSPQRSALPASSLRETILKATRSRVLVVSGSTGCGKSTQIPQFLLEGMIAGGMEDQANILVTQPRRVAATSLAYRVSEERESSPPGRPGSVVGYHVRLDRAISPTTKIVYCTIGILLRMLVAHPSHDHVPLAHISHLVIDEVHERDINTDFCLTLIRTLLQRNSEVRIILMSATASVQLFVDYFHAHQPSVIEISGRTFPVTVKWLADCERFASSKLQGWTHSADDSKDTISSTMSPRAREKIDNEFVKKLVRKIIAEEQREPGSDTSKRKNAILIFLPGKPEIQSLAKSMIDDYVLKDKNVCQIVKLHGTLSRTEQQSAFDPPQGDAIKVVLATNAAETSITIEDVKHVIDAGRVKENRFNAESRISELVTVWVSQAAAKQRLGRAGRTSSGVCWRLFSDTFYETNMSLQTCPEILRSPLDSSILQICLMYEHRQQSQTTSSEPFSALQGVCPITFLSNTPEPPREDNIIEACRHLLEVGAISVVNEGAIVRYRLTPLGYHLSRLPVDAKVGKVLIVGCMLGVLDNALIIASTLSCTKQIFLPVSAGEEGKAISSSRATLIESGFGGRNWKGGTVKGDSIASLTAYFRWSGLNRGKSKAQFCRKYGLNGSALHEIQGIQGQLKDCLREAGFLDEGLDFYNRSKEDALLTSCCLVGGLYPNVCTLMRPRKGGLRGGRLITKDGDICRPSSGSFQTQRVKNANETGRDAYAVFHAKHRSVGTGNKPGDVFLSDVNFVSRFALLLFGGELEIRDNALIIDDWLKFKVGPDDKTSQTTTRASAVLILELRRELDRLVLRHFTSPGGTSTRESGEENGESPILDIIRSLLAEEKS